MERVGLGRRREGEFFLYGSVCYEQVGVSSFFFGVAGVLYNCTITHGQLCFVWAGEGRRGGSGGVLIYGRFYTLVLYRSVVGKRRYHGAMGCEEEGGGRVMDRTDNAYPRYLGALSPGYKSIPSINKRVHLVNLVCSPDIGSQGAVGCFRCPRAGGYPSRPSPRRWKGGEMAGGDLGWWEWWWSWR